MIDIESFIPGFNLISNDAQQAFLVSPEGRELLFLCQSHTSSSLYTMQANLATRTMLHQQRIHNIRACLERMAASEVFLQLQSRIIARRVARIFPSIDLLSDTDMEHVLSRPYSKSLLRRLRDDDKHTWRVSFFADQDEQTQAILANMFAQYHDSFGFLFKMARNGQQLSDMADDLDAMRDVEARKQLLQNMIDHDWSIQTSILQSISLHVQDSLGWLLAHPAKMTQAYADSIADAHVVYRFFGLSSENMLLGMEGLPLLDMYNYHKHRQAISESLEVWQALKIPLNPFFEEYIELGKFEKNPLSICLRAFMPFLVMAAFLTLGYSLVLPLAVHQFLEYLLFIPTLYLSIAGAGLYVECKNMMWAATIGWWYGNIYLSPQFQANDRIEHAFLDETLSARVAAYYAHCFQECDRIESIYQSRQGALSEEEITRRNNNLKLKFDLYLEWYDLHDRQELGIDKIPMIVLKRLQQDEMRLTEDIKIYSHQYVKCFTATFFKDDSFRQKFDHLKRCLQDIESFRKDIMPVISRTQNHSSDNTEYQLIQMQRLL